jgi:hypothetical protein
VENEAVTWDQTLFVSALLLILQFLTLAAVIILCVLIAGPDKNARLESWVRTRVLGRADTDLTS